MSTVVSVESRIRHVEVSDDAIIAHLIDGRVISVPSLGRGTCQTPRQRSEATGS